MSSNNDQVKLAPDAVLTGTSIAILDSDAFQELVLPVDSTTQLKKAAYAGLHAKFTKGVRGGEDVLDFGDFTEALAGANDTFTSNELLLSISNATSDELTGQQRVFLNNMMYEQDVSHRKAVGQMWDQATEIDQYHQISIDEMTAKKSQKLFGLLKQQEDAFAAAAEATAAAAAAAAAAAVETETETTPTKTTEAVKAIKDEQVEDEDDDMPVLEGEEDDDLPPLEDLVVMTQSSTTTKSTDDDNEKNDGSDDDMPGLDDIEEVMAKGLPDDSQETKDKITTWLHDVATTDPNEITTNQQTQIDRQTALKEKSAQYAKSSEGKNKGKVEQIETGFTSAANSTIPTFDEGLLGVAFDFRHNLIPAGCSVVNQAHFERQGDGSTALVLEPGAYLQLEPKFASNISKRGCYTVSMEVWFDKLPENTITLTTIDIGRSGCGETQLSRDGIISLVSGDQATLRLKPRAWQKVVLAFDPVSKNYWEASFLAQLNNRIIINSRDTSSALNDKGCFKDKLFLFGSNKSSLMDRTIKIRSALIQPKMIQTYDAPPPDSGGFSNWLVEAADDKLEMYRSMSLSSLFNRPPPAWGHPLISSTLLQSLSQEQLEGVFFSPGDLVLWSSLLTQTAETQSRFFPLMKLSSTEVEKDDKKQPEIHPDLQYSLNGDANNAFVSNGLNAISGMWTDAAAIAKSHPTVSQAPTSASYVKRLCSRIQGLQVGESTIIPFTFRHRVKPLDPQDGLRAAQVAILFVIRVDSTERCTVTVCNTAVDGGVKFHSLSAAGAEGSMEYKPCITVQDVPLSNVSSYGAWYALHEAINSGKQTMFTWVSDIYYKILPTLLGQSWEHVLYQSQQRDLAFTKIKVSGQLSKMSPDELIKFNKRYADCSSVPLIGIGTTSQLIHYTTQFLFRQSLGCNTAQGSKLFLALKLRCLDMCYNDMSYINVINPSERYTVESCIKETAAYATQCLESIDDDVQPTQAAFSSQQLFMVYRGISRLQRELKTVKIISYANKTQQSLLLDDGGRAKDSQHTLFPFAENFIPPRNPETIIDLDSSGVISFDLLDLPYGMRSWGDLIYVLRRTKEVFAAVRNQATKIKNADALAISFITHLFSHVIPVPTAYRASPEQRASDPFASPATYAELSQVLELCSHFLTMMYVLSALDISAQRHQRQEDNKKDKKDKFGPYEAQVIGGALFTIVDVCLHKAPSDQRSRLVDTINQGGFGLAIGSYITATKGFHLHTPELAILRSKVLEYFALSPYKYNFLTLETPASGPEFKSLMAILRIGVGIEPNNENFRHTSPFDVGYEPIYFTLPEFGFVTRAVIIFRSLCLSPISLSTAYINANQAYLNSCQLYENNGRLQGSVSSVQLSMPQEKYHAKYRSWADPHHIINTHLKNIHCQTASADSFIDTIIKTEDDILHIKSLPTFDNVLSPADVEQLLCYLTAPYLRIPLVTSFFATEDRCHALKNSDLRDIFTAILFEQGGLVPFHKDSFLPTQVPSSDQSLIGTHYGFLLNELVYNPSLIVNNLIAMFNSALELDIGTVQSAATPIILFIIRILTRVENYIHWLIDLNQGKVRLYKSETLPGLSLSPEQLVELIRVREVLAITTHGIALSKLNNWSAQLFTTVHMKLEQNEFAHQKANKFVKLAKTALATHKANEDQDDEESDEEIGALDGVKRPGNTRSARGRGHYGYHNRHGGGDDEAKAPKIKIAKFKNESDGLKKFQLFSQQQFTANMKAAGLGSAREQRYGMINNAASIKNSSFAALGVNEGRHMPYQFEDNRQRRVIKYRRKHAQINSLDVDAAETNPEGEEGGDDNKTTTEAEFVVSVKEDQETKTFVRLDGEELTDLLELSCIVHAHILMIRRNVLEMNPHAACHIVSSILYLSTHFSWKSALTPRPDIFEIIHKHRRALITTSDGLSQQALNDFMEKVIKVATSIAPLDLASMVFYLKQELGYSTAQMDDPLPTDHPLYEQVQAFEEFQLEWDHSLNGSKNPLGFENYKDPSTNPELEGIPASALTAEDYGVSPQNFKSRSLRHFGYSPGSRGRYTSLADPFTIQAENYMEYYSQVPGDLYDKNLDCEINLQSLSISIRNATMQNIPDQVLYSQEWQEVFRKSLQAALIESNSKFNHYRVIGTGYDVYHHISDAVGVVELVNQRIYTASELHSDEQWLAPIFEPYRLQHFNDPWNPLLIYLPDSPLPADADVAILQVAARRSGAVLMQVRVYKQRKMVETYRYLYYNFQVYPSLAHTSDVRHTLQEAHQDFRSRQTMWETFNRYASVMDVPSQVETITDVIQRDTTEVENLSGTIETYIPQLCLAGLIPSELLSTHLFWQDTHGNLRGYPNSQYPEESRHLAPANFQEFVYFCELHTVSKHDATRLRTTCFQVSKVPIAVMKLALEVQLKAAAFKAQSSSTLALTSSLIRQSSSNSTSTENNTVNTTSYPAEDLVLIPHLLAEKRSLRQHASTASFGGNNTKKTDKSPSSPSDSDQIYELINLKHAPKGSSSYQIASVLTRTVNSLGCVLPWKPATGTFNKHGIQLNTEIFVSHYEDEVPSFADGNTNNDQVKAAADIVADDDCNAGLLLDDVIDPIFGANTEVLDLDVVKKRQDLSSKLINYHHIEIPSVALSFRSQFNASNEIQLYSIDHNDLYVSNIKSEQLERLLNGLPHGLVLQNINNELDIIVPAATMIRPRVSDSPYSTEISTSSRLVQHDTTYFKYKVHSSHSFMFLPTLGAALYLIVAKMLARDYDAVIKLLDSISADIPFSPFENALIGLMQQCATDIFIPNALSTMIRISLATLSAAKSQPWDVYILALYYGSMNLRQFTSSLHRISYREEYNLLVQLQSQGTLNAAIKLATQDSMHHGIFVLALYNRFTYLTSLIYKLPSYKVLLPPATQHKPAFGSSTLPGADEFVVWYTKALEKCNLKLIPTHTLNEPTQRSSMNNNAVSPSHGAGNITFGSMAATAQEEIQNSIPLSILAKLPAKSRFKLDITNIQPQFKFIGTLSTLSAQALLGLGPNSSLTHRSGHGFLLAYMLFTGDCSFKMFTQDDSARLGAFLAQMFKDNLHNSPLNFILRVLIQKPELAPLFPRFSQFKALNQIRSAHSSASTFDLAPFLMMVSRLIVKLFVVSPQALDLTVTSPKSSWTVAPGSAKKLTQPAQTIPMCINNTVPSLKQSSAFKHEFVAPVLTDTDCTTRFSIDHNLFLNDALKAKLGPLLQDLYAQELNEKTSFEEISAKTVSPITQLNQLQSQPISTLDIQLFVQQVTRSDKSLPPISEALPFDISTHPAAQNSNAKLMNDRFEKDIVIYAQTANKTFDSLFALLSSTKQVTTVLANPSGNEMKMALGQLDQLARSVTALRQQDIKFVSIGQRVVNALVNNVGLPPQFQSKIGKLYAIGSTCFTDADCDIKSLDTNDNSLENRQVAQRLHFLLSREAGYETSLWFEYVVGSLLSSRATYDLLKVNPYIPDDFISLIFALTEAILLRTNRISHINRTLNEIIDLQGLLYKVKSTYNLHKADGIDHFVDNVIVNSVLQKSQTTVTTLLTKRYYFQDVEESELEVVKDKLKYDIQMKKVWNNILNESKKAIQTNNDNNSNTSPGLSVATPIMIEQLSRIIDEQIVSQDVRLFDQQQRAIEAASKGNIDAVAETGTILKKTTVTSKNRRHIAKQLMVDPLARVQSHPLKASCPIRDRVGFLLKAVQKRSALYIGESWERVKAGQGINSQDNPLWDALHQTPEYIPRIYKEAKQGRYGLSLYARTGLSQESIDIIDKDNNAKGLKKYDPRFLVFEWTWSLLLRKTQVEMIYSFVDKMDKGESIIQGLIMGAGKTMVITPLLFQFLSTSKENNYSRHLGQLAREKALGKEDKTKSEKEQSKELASSNMDKLIISVVPPALLEFSRGVMRTTFSSVIYKRVITFHFERATEPTYDLLNKLKNAAKERSVVISTPTAIKSVQLKFLELQYSIANPALGRDANAATQLNILTEILQLFKRSVLIMDEVDMILNPLKSELNFPFSQKTDLDFSPLRWSLALHIMDAVLYYDQRVLPHQFKHSTRAIGILNGLVKTLDYGFNKKYLQSTPHLLLLNEPFYFTKIQAHIVEWILLFVDTQHLPGSVTHKDIKKFFSTTTAQLSSTTDEEMVKLSALLSTLSPPHMKLLNLSRDWLMSYLPHILQKVSRVHYGLLSPQDLAMALATDPAIPLSRMKLAIPFKGKDSPSASSEFAHSEIIIGLTISSYCREGLRYTDFVEIVDSLRTSLVKELGPYSKRPANVRYVEWINASGGVVMGAGSVPKPTHKASEQGNHIKFSEGGEMITDEDGQKDSSSSHAAGEQSESAIEIVSLRLLKRTNYQQMDRLYNLLKHSPLVIQYYLDTMIFPSCLRHQNLKLSASGVDIGSDLLFPKRIGFSGTPSDLLPLDLGGCNYEIGADGQVITTLTSPEVANIVDISDNWSIHSILKTIAQSRTPEGNLKYHAFIDVAALITGMSNHDVAQYLLENGLGESIDGVVYLDENDSKMVLLKSSLKSVPVDQCGIPPQRRFAFYDQIHTTGIDISHRLDCHAALSLSKDSLFRDFSQGAYRLRQIGNGQTLDILITPEMKSLINRTLAPIETGPDGKQDLNGSKLLAPLQKLLAQRQVTNPNTISTYQQLARVSAFLIINSMTAERTQFCQLAIQNCANVWKKNVFKQLLEKSSYFDFNRFPTPEATVKREKMLEKQQEDTKQQKFLTSIEGVRDTNRKQYQKLVKRYQAVKKQNKAFEQKRQQQTLLQEYFEQAMAIYNIQLRSQIKNLAVNRNPQTAVDGVMKNLRNYLQQLRKGYYKNNPSYDPKTQQSLLGKIGGYVVDFDDNLSGAVLTSESDEKKLSLAESTTVGAILIAENDDANKDNKSNTKDTEMKELESQDGGKKLSSYFASVEEMEELSRSTERDLSFEALMTVFHEVVDLTVNENVPKFVSFSDSLKKRIEEHQHLLVGPQQHETCQMIFQSVVQTANAEETYTLNAEMVQTMEDERVKEQEQDREQQVEIEKFVDCAYDRSNEAQVSWPFESLANTNMDELPQFYHLNELSVVPLSSHTLSVFDNNDEEKIAFFSSEQNRLSAKFPSQIYATSNYYNNSWVGARRLKNVSMYLDWTPSLMQVVPLTDLTKIQTYSSFDLKDSSLSRDLEVAIKSILFLSTCENGIANPPTNGARDYNGLYKLLSQDWETAQLTQQNVDDLLYLLTMRHNNFYKQSLLPTETTVAAVATEFVANDTIDVSTLQNTGIATELHLDHSTLFNNKTTISAKDFITALTTTTSVLYPGNTYQDKRYTVIVSLAEAETLRRIVHVKQEIAMQKYIASRTKTQQKRGPAALVQPATPAVVIPFSPEDIIAKTDAGFALRCMNFNGVALATTTQYRQPSYTQFNNSLLLLRFINNDVHFSDPQASALIGLLDGNVTTSPFGIQQAPQLNQFGVPEATLAQFFTSLLGARRRLQTKIMESSIKTILYTPNRYVLVKDSAIAFILRKFIDLAQSSSFDLFTWMDFNIDTSISPGEFYRALQYLMINMWKYYVNNDTANPDTTTILSQVMNTTTTGSEFYIKHQDIIQVFTSTLGINSVTANSSSSVVSTSVKQDTTNVTSSTQNFQLSQQAFGLRFKDFCAMLKTTEEPDADDEVGTNGNDDQKDGTTPPTSPTAGLMSPLPPTTPVSGTNGAVTIPLDDRLTTLDHDVFAELVASNTISQDVLKKSLYVIPTTTNSKKTTQGGGDDDESSDNDKKVGDEDDETRDNVEGTSSEDGDNNKSTEDDDDDEANDHSKTGLDGLGDDDEDTPAKRRERLEAAATKPLHYITKTKTIYVNFTTPELPDFVKLIGGGHFVDAETGNPADNYWEINPYSALVINTPELNKHFHSTPSNTTAMSVELASPAIEESAQGQNVGSFRPSEQVSRFGQLYQDLTIAKASLLKYIFCFQSDRDHTYWINPAEIETQVTQQDVDEFMVIHDKAEEGDVESVKILSTWPFELRRAIKYHNNCQKEIEIETERIAQLYPIAGNDILNHPRLTNGWVDTPEIFRFILSQYESAPHSVLPVISNASLAYSAKNTFAFERNNNSAPFSIDNFTALTFIGANEHQATMYSNTDPSIPNIYGLPSLNTVPLTLFGSTDFDSCRTTVKIRKVVFFNKFNEAEFKDADFKEHFICAYSAAAQQQAKKTGGPGGPNGMMMMGEGDMMMAGQEFYDDDEFIDDEFMDDGADYGDELDGLPAGAPPGCQQQ